MLLYILVGGVVAAASGSLFFSTLTYSLRDFLRPRLQDRFRRLGNERWFQTTVDHAQDLVFVTAVARLLSNIMVLLFVLRLFYNPGHSLVWQYLSSVAVTALITLFASVAIPNAAAKYAAETFIALCAPLLYGLRVVMLPVTKLMHGTDALMRRITGSSGIPGSGEVDEEIMSVVEEAEKEGVVAEDEREMIESVIEFRGTSAGQIMTARPEMVAIELPATLDDVKRTIELSGHSRIPVFEGSLDKIVGILYARDLLKYVGLPSDQFDIRTAMRPAIYAPETKPLRDLLRDFKLQKVHIAIVLDEYGGTAGLITIEDVLEELVGDISDEHEPQEPAMLKKLSDTAWEADARIHIDELNRTVGLNLSEDEGYETLGGFVSTTLGRIPTNGTTFDHAGVRFLVLSAEPQKVNRLRIELPANAEEQSTRE